MTYHLREIKKGVLGEYSKVVEEFEEFKEALEQRNPLMAILELSDMLGALRMLMVKTATCEEHLCMLEFSFEEHIKHANDSPQFTTLPLNTIKWMMVREIHKGMNNDEDYGVLLSLISSYVSHYNFTLYDILTMSSATQRAFLSGHRK